jgi:hypothetical protein
MVYTPDGKSFVEPTPKTPPQNLNDLSHMRGLLQKQLNNLIKSE